MLFTIEPTGRVTVAQEVETLKLYLDIERMRFEERLGRSADAVGSAGHGALLIGHARGAAQAEAPGSGDLLLHVVAGLAEDALGSVRCIVAPNSLHHLHRHRPRETLSRPSSSEIRHWSASIGSLRSLRSLQTQESYAPKYSNL